MELKVKKINPYAYLPTKGTKNSVGWDLYIPDKHFIASAKLPRYEEKKFHCWKGEIKIVDFGIAVEIPEGYWGQMVIRSSIGKQGLTMANSVGVIDSDYRGTLRAMVLNAGPLERILLPGDRIAQLIIHKVEDVDVVEADELSESDRGTKGFGSTGK